MYSLNHTRPSKVHLQRRGLATPTLRTYRQIATILTAREMEPISPARVELLCRRAETKIVKALLANPETPSRLRTWR